ncbi:MAG: fasciclin domain-containing protein [Proteobacteria bacterium]|nr:fasciclin domain-containing protein [Pseudomonadota bacterium]
MKAKMLGTLLACVIAAGCAAQADNTNPMVGGAPMYQSKNIIDNAVNSKDHTTLVAAVKAAGLVETLQGPGPFTVFAPTNAAFAKLPAGTVESLVQPENKTTLTSILTYHVVPGTLDAKTLMADIAKGNGKAMLKTVNGEDLTLEQTAKGIVVSDMKGDKSMVTIADVRQSNGIIHVVDTVLLP